MMRYIYFSIGLLICPIAVVAQTDPSQAMLSPTALFSRCYAHIRGIRPDTSNPLYQQVVSGKLTPVDACMQLLAKANFVAVSQSTLSAAQKATVTPSNQAMTYTPRIIADPTDGEAIDVLNRFYNFHRMWFSAQDLANVPANIAVNFYFLNNDRLNDPTEPALFLTRALFEPGIQYKEVVTGNYGVRGIRSLGAWVRDYFTGSTSAFNLQVPGAGLERGLLWGIAPYTSEGNSNWMTDNGTLVSTFNHGNATSISRTFSGKRNYGGGIPGLSTYVLMNSGFPTTAGGGEDSPTNDPTEINSGRSNASRRMHRRWAQNVLHDMLCRDLPSLQLGDVASLVSNYTSSFKDETTRLPFRSSSACMSCHASIDPLAATARSLYFDHAINVNWLTPSELGTGKDATTSPAVPIVASTHSITSIPAKGSPVPAAYQLPETPPGGEYSMMSRDPLFSYRPDSGDLRYRSYDGSLVWLHIKASADVDGLAQLGTALSQSNDLYVCAASRYLKYFTGIEVNLQDPTDSRFPALSADDLHYRDVAVQLGLSLKKHQSLTQLIKEIMSSNLYQKQSMRDVSP